MCSVDAADYPAVKWPHKPAIRDAFRAAVRFTVIAADTEAICSTFGDTDSAT